MGKAFIMIGLPGSGKSTIANKLAKEYDATIISTDNIRLEFYGSMDIIGGDEVFIEARKRILKCLKNNKNFIYDATNARPKNRYSILKLAKNFDYTTYRYYKKVSLEIALERNENRERKVPILVIEKLNNIILVPKKEEFVDYTIINED